MDTFSFYTNKFVLEQTKKDLLMLQKLNKKNMKKRLNLYKFF